MRKLEDNIKIDPKMMCYEDDFFIYMAKGKVQWLALVNMAMNILIP
jgi:hypothetical protein